MDLSKYSKLSGVTVSDSDSAYVEAQIRRTQATLETLLGYSLTKQKANTNFYNEKGKSTLNCFCPNVDTSNLLPPDEVENSYRLYPYNPDDKFLFIDPFTTVYSVKLVYVQPGDPEENGITLKTFDIEDIRIEMGREGIGKYIQDCHWNLCLCEDVCRDCVQLAVDAEWVNQDCLPDDLMYVWSDMVTFNSDEKNGIRSESILSHSYTKFDRVVPETEPQNLAIIRRYAGPYGSASVQPVW